MSAKRGGLALAGVLLALAGCDRTQLSAGGVAAACDGGACDAGIGHTGPDVPTTPVLTCAAPLILCGDHCADVQRDGSNCGLCRHACGGTQVCSHGACVELQSPPPPLTCAAPLSLCGDHCADIQHDPASCGACGHAC